MICDTLNIKPGALTIIGSGGKTSLLLTLANELSCKGRVIVMTTTKMYLPTEMPIVFSSDVAELSDALAKNNVICVGAHTVQSKLCQPDIPISVLKDMCDYLLVEGDGSKRLPLKAHAYYEPVIPPENDRTLLVAGALGIGGTIENNVHRPELFCSLCDALISDEATPERIARVINHEALSNEVIINQCDNAELRAGAERLAQRLRATVYIACLKECLLCSF